MQESLWLGFRAGAEGVDSVRSDVQVLVGLVATDFPAALRRLLADLANDVIRSGLTTRDVAVIVAENSVTSEARTENRAIVEAFVRGGLAVDYVDEGEHGRSIATSRHALTREIARWASRGRRAAVYWMIDDDLRLGSLRLADDFALRLIGEPYVERWIHIREMSPDVDLAVGFVTDDPPIRPEMMVRTQLGDLVANLTAMAQLDPALRNTPAPSAVFDLPDYYYDLSEQGDGHLELVAPWLADAACGPTVREQTLAMLEAAQDIPLGRAVTRPVVDRGTISSGNPGDDCRRGGNAAFFNLEACLTHPYPRLAVAGVALRRSDMVGAALLRNQGFTVRRVPVALRHLRSSNRPGGRGRARTRQDVWSSILAEFFGVMVARLVMEPSNDDGRERVTRLAAWRASRIVANLHAAAAHLDRLKGMVRDPIGWLGEDAEAMVALQNLAPALDELAVVVGGHTSADREAWLGDLHAHLTAPGHIEETIVQADQALREAHEQRRVVFAALEGAAR